MNIIKPLKTIFVATLVTATVLNAPNVSTKADDEISPNTETENILNVEVLSEDENGNNSYPVENSDTITELDTRFETTSDILADFDKYAKDAEARRNEAIQNDIEIQSQIAKDTEAKKKAMAKAAEDTQASIDNQKKVELLTKSIEEASREFIGTYELTAYIATGSRCASGVYPTVNHTVACNSLPFGTKIYIEGIGEFVVEDTGGMANNVIDIFVSDYSTAINFGRRSAKVYIIK